MSATSGWAEKLPKFVVGYSLAATSLCSRKGELCVCVWSRALSRARVPWWRHRQAAEHLRKGPGRRRRQRQRPEEQSLRHFPLLALRSTAQQGEEQGSEDATQESTERWFLTDQHVSAA